MPRSTGAAYRTVQGLARGLAVLRALNSAVAGRANVRELSEVTSLHRTTVRRLLETLIDQGLVRRAASSDDSYGLTLGVRTLSEGFTDHAWISATAAPVMGDLMKAIRWPSDLTTLDGDSMLIRESTHRFSSLSFDRAEVGSRMPLLFSASGRAYLAGCGQGERKLLLELMAAGEGRQATCAQDPVLVRNIVARVRHDGFASNEGDWRPASAVGSIALPIRSGRSVRACLNVVYLRKAYKREEAARRYLEPLRGAVRDIERALKASERRPADDETQRKSSRRPAP